MRYPGNLTGSNRIIWGLPMVIFALNPPHRAKRPKKSCRSRKIGFGVFIFFHVAENEPKEDARVPRPLRGCPARRPTDR
jgi:hypothetical protein